MPQHIVTRIFERYHDTFYLHPSLPLQKKHPQFWCPCRFHEHELQKCLMTFTKRKVGIPIQKFEWKQLESPRLRFAWFSAFFRRFFPPPPLCVFFSVMDFDFLLTKKKWSIHLHRIIFTCPMEWDSSIRTGPLGPIRHNHRFSDTN